MDLINLCKYLDSSGVTYKRDYLIKYNTHLKAGGKVELYIFPSCLKHLESTLVYLKRRSCPFKVVGGTTNTMFFDELYYGIVINTRNVDFFSCEGDVFTVDCGYSTQEFVRSALVAGCGGIEGLEGIPGTVGGAIFMNAAAYGYSISDYIENVRCMDNYGTVMNLNKEDCRFSYRHSTFKDNPSLTILSATFRLPKVDKELSEKKIEAFHIARHSYQEFVYPTLGSLFSTPRDIYAEVIGRDKIALAVLFLLKLVLKNPIAKRIRKYPSLRVFNNYILTRGFLRRVEQPISKKTLNTMINSVDSSTQAKLEFSQAIRDRIGEDILIENEFVVWPLKESCEANDEFLKKIAPYSSILKWKG